MTGLGERWRKVYPAYRKLVSVYERMNLAMTWGNVDKWRRQLAALVPDDAEKILDAGCGPGNMTRHLLRPGRYVVGLDYSIEMLKALKYDIDKVQGVFESLPFRDGYFDVAVLAYALHAARDLERALDELTRVAGAVAAVSMGAPDNPIVRGLFKLYVAVFVPFLALLLAPSHLREYTALSDILSVAPPNRVFKSILSRWMRLESFTTRGFGAIYIFYGTSRRFRRHRFTGGDGSYV
ncbi:class I SAM-dependent methyltransferase [Thermoproteus tenax]|uniref:Methylase, UbiE family n=1 Tax=Thermoproteus tenax (strain ATCC 35583 / DSM 2078 / JCM 9277 / NBRC 100435 / Kra 1) TaxID=768679 RepID=G4RP64_THETK|nr:class I SAM-dependent methyltransferase [Thermoproteus tenax]CCC81359.1 Methylase, UbiE family [Thermoproteus tenax Kra 1]